jgi:hypothetical protein
MPRVGRLSSPAPSLRQHLRSWLPGGRGFLAVHVPGNLVLSAGRLTPLGRTGERGPLVVSGRLPDGVRRDVMSATCAQQVVEVERVVAPRRRYGSDRAVELVAVRADVPSLLGARRAGSCAVCELRHDGPTCPFCHGGSVAADVQSLVPDPPRDPRGDR